MRKFLKVTLLILLVTLPVLAISLVATLLLLDPNEYKPQLENLIHAQTGYQINIEGQLDLKFFPNLSLAAKEVLIQNPKGFQHAQLGTAQEAIFEIQWLPLIKREIKLATLILKAPQLYLERNANGLENWQIQSSVTPAEVQTLPAIESPSRVLAVDTSQTMTTPPARTLHWEIANVAIEQAMVHFQDVPNQLSYQLQDVHFSSQAIHPQRPFSITASGDLALQDQAQKTQFNAKKSKISGVLQLDSAKKQFTMRQLSLASVVEDLRLGNQPINLELKAKLTGNWQLGQLDWSNLKLTANDNQITGTLQLGWLGPLSVAFQLQSPYLDITPWLALNNRSATTELASAPLTHSEWVQPVAYQPSAAPFKINGQLQLAKLKVQDHVLEDLQLQVNSKQHMLHIAPLSAKLYQGHFTGRSSIDLQSKTPQWQLKGQLTNVALAPLLNDLIGKPSIQGIGNAQLDLRHTAQGLQGTTKLQLEQGFIEGLDLNYYFTLARALIKKEPTPPQDSNQARTPFNQITGTWQAKNNILTNRDLALDSNDFTAQGQGTLDLNQQQIQYQIVAQHRYSDGQAHANALPIAVRIYGPFQQPMVVPDIDAYVRKVVERELQKQVNQQLNKGLNKVLGSDTVPDSEGETVPEQKLQDSLEKGLKKLFKF
jgi:AsmA protein